MEAIQKGSLWHYDRRLFRIEDASESQIRWQYLNGEKDSADKDYFLEAIKARIFRPVENDRLLLALKYAFDVTGEDRIMFLLDATCGASTALRDRLDFAASMRTDRK